MERAKSKSSRSMSRPSTSAPTRWSDNERQHEETTSGDTAGQRRRPARLRVVRGRRHSGTQSLQRLGRTDLQEQQLGRGSTSGPGQGLGQEGQAEAGRTGLLEGRRRTGKDAEGTGQRIAAAGRRGQ